MEVRSQPFLLSKHFGSFLSNEQHQRQGATGTFGELTKASVESPIRHVKWVAHAERGRTVELVIWNERQGGVRCCEDCEECRSSSGSSSRSSSRSSSSLIQYRRTYRFFFVEAVTLRLHAAHPHDENVVARTQEQPPVHHTQERSRELLFTRTNSLATWKIRRKCFSDRSLRVCRP